MPAPTSTPAATTATTTTLAATATPAATLAATSAMPAASAAAPASTARSATFSRCNKNWKRNIFGHTFLANFQKISDTVEKSFVKLFQKSDFLKISRKFTEIFSHLPSFLQG